MLRHSLVIPCFNEAGNLEPLLAAAFPVLDGLGEPGSWEAILVDDGSTDGTSALLDTLAGGRSEMQVIHFPVNRGQAAALLTGLQTAHGEILLTMDGDGQNDPRDLPVLLETMAATGADLVCGWRHDRHDTVVRRLMSRLANAVSSRVMGDGLHDNGCQLRVMRREIVATLIPGPLMQSFLPAMAVAAGFHVTEVRVRHHPRAHGISQYGLRNLWLRPFLEMLRLRRILRRRGPVGSPKSGGGGER